MAAAPFQHDPSCPGCVAPDLAFAPHDHAHCTTDVLAHADAVAAARGVRLTPVRRRSLEILLESHQAMGAYEVLERLARDGFGNQPPVAYRALEFLVAHGLVHRIQQLNAYVACMHPGQVHAPAFLICTRCNVIAEAELAVLRDGVQDAAGRIGFVVDRVTIEALGTCPACRAVDAP